jgi:8-oxo-dGTP pyrophosphatase MutT (NUDIX family)
MIHTNLPARFSPRFEIVSCYIEWDSRILLLHRNEGKSGGGKWGLPAGKVERGENIVDAIIREIREETGHDLDADRDKLRYLRKVYVRYPEYDFVFHMFKMQMDNGLNVILRQSEHQAYSWHSPKDTLDLNLVRGLDACVKMIYNC